VWGGEWVRGEGGPVGRGRAGWTRLGARAPSCAGAGR